MTPDIDSRVFRKRYPNADKARAAAANHRWLSRLEPLLRLPPLTHVSGHEVTFAHVEGRHAAPADLEPLAAHLGNAHGHAYATELHQARLDVPFRSATGHVLPSFIAPRVAAVRRRLASGLTPAPHLSADEAEQLLFSTAATPAAFYKDTNPRNILITTDGPVTVDFDDLDLAPFGYDLAKLIVSLEMTHGALPVEAIERALRAYNTAIRRHEPSLDEVTWSRLMAFAEIHHILTSPYIGRNGYRFGWLSVRPQRAGSTIHDPREVHPWP